MVVVVVVMSPIRIMETTNVTARTLLYGFLMLVDVLLPTVNAEETPVIVVVLVVESCCRCHQRDAVVKPATEITNQSGWHQPKRTSTCHRFLLDLGTFGLRSQVFHREVMDPVSTNSRQ